jgi:hypothetical protein
LGAVMMVMAAVASPAAQGATFHSAERAATATTATTTTTTVVGAGPASVASVSAPAGLVRPRPGVHAAAAAQAPAAPTVGIMTYHGGPVMHNVTAYAVYWQPSGTYMSPNYKTLMNRWFGDIGNTGAYNVAQQYGDGAGPPGLSVTFGGGWTDTTAFPNHQGSQANPVLGQSVANEVVAALAANPGWKSDLSHVVFVYLPKGVYLSGGTNSVSFVNFCAYHFGYALSGETTVSHPVGAMPYVGTDPAHCDAYNGAAPAAPNGDSDADSEINISSHEFFETVTDPTGQSGWYYQSVNAEIGDQCNFVFGPFDSQGGDIVLSGHEYIMQSEWSNRAANPANPQPADGCVNNQPLAASFSYPLDGQSSVDTTRPFAWSTVPGAQAYVLIVGNSAYRADLANSGVLPAGQTAYYMPALPTGQNLYATLFTQMNGNWYYQAITFTAAVGQGRFTYPVNGQLGVDTTKAFTWSTIPAAQGYVVIVGTTLYGTDLGSSGVLSPSVSSFNMADLPSGPVVYATLFTEVNGNWNRYQAIGFVSAPGHASFTYPLNGQQNVDPSQSFAWSTIPGAQGYLVAVGTTPSSADVVNSGVLPPGQSTFNVGALPLGRVLYGFVFTEVNGAWSRYQLIGFIAH